MNEPRPTSPQPAGPQSGAPLPPRVPGIPQSAPKISGVPVQSMPKDDLDPISLVDEPAKPAHPTPTPGAHPHPSQPPVSKIVFGPETGRAAHKYKRLTVATGQGAVRVRSFHGRLSDEGMAFMDEKINDWLDTHPEIEVKIVTTTIGTFEGKIREPALVVNVWY